MKALRLVLCVVVLATLASATQGTWLLYYSDTEIVNGDGSLTITPTVGISGDDGGYCNIESGFYGWETPLVMLNGNAWVTGDTQGAGGENYGGYPLDFSYTFPDVTIPSNGTQVDLSYAGKVQGICYLTYSEGAEPPFNLASFFVTTFIDGSGSISPSPCFLGGSPVCSLPFPYSFQTVPAHGHPSDLDSEQVSQARSTCPSNTTITLGALTQENLNNVLATYKTGIGANAKMQVSPAMPTGTLVTESLSQISFTCPQSWKTAGAGCHRSDNTTTGTLAVGYPGALADDTRVAATPNVFWDEHVVLDSVSLLDFSGINSCSFACKQQYSCGATPVKSYTVTFSFSKGNINGTPVTQVGVTKQ